MIINGANDLKKYIAEQTRLIQQIREEYLCDIQQERATVEVPTFPSNSSWNYRAQMCRSDHNSFIYKRTGLPQYSTFLQKEDQLNEALEQLEHLRKMLVTNKQQKKTGIRKIHEIINLVKTTERQGQRQLSSTFEFVDMSSITTAMDDDYDYDYDYDYDRHNEFTLEAPDSETVKALKAQIETTKQNHRTISRNLLQQVNTIVKSVKHNILDVKISAEDNVGEIIHHAEKCRAFIAKCFNFAVLDYCASAWWHQTQKDPMDHNYYHIEVETVNPDDATFNPNANNTAPPTANDVSGDIRICVYEGFTVNTDAIVHLYEFDEELAQEIYSEELLCEVGNNIQHW